MNASEQQATHNPSASEPAKALPRSSWTNRDPSRMAFDPRAKSPGLASFLSIAPGLGQVYVGYYVVGFIHILTVATLIVILGQPYGHGPIPEDVKPLFGVLLAFFWAYNIIDAGRRAALYNLAIQGGDEPGIPKLGALPTGGGTQVAGATLFIIGFVLLLNTAFDFSLWWLEDWWPLAPMGFGAYLLYRSRRDGQERQDGGAASRGL